MGITKPRGTKIIYVAASARELPPDVQEWLTQAGNRALPSPNIYDAMSLLVTGRSPSAMIISMEAVDWSEMEFFEHAARVSRSTVFFVTGPEHLQPKIQAACARGAQAFDTEALEAQLSTGGEFRNAGPGGLLAGSLRPGGLRAAPLPAPAGDAVVVEPEEPAAPAPETERPVVRLVTGADVEEPAATVPFPWSPSPNRPQRTPPKVVEVPLNVEPAAEVTPEAPPAAPRRTPPPVKLTPDELSALLGRPGPAQEQRP